MKIYGLQKTTLLDYPGKVSCTVFTGGCNFNCPFCHNKELVKLKNNLPIIPENTFFDFLHKRKNVLEGVCITGGEPLMQDGIGDFIAEIKKIGYKVKLDTNGSFPEKLKKLNPNFIAMDIKTSLDKYYLVTKLNKDLPDKIKESINYIIKSKINHEFRTTVVPTIVDTQDIQNICPLIKNADIYTLAQFRNKETLDISFKNLTPYNEEYLFKMKNIVESFNIPCKIRGIL